MGGETHALILCLKFQWHLLLYESNLKCFVRQEIAVLELGAHRLVKGNLISHTVIALVRPKASFGRRELKSSRSPLAVEWQCRYQTPSLGYDRKKQSPLLKGQD